MADIFCLPVGMAHGVALGTASNGVVGYNCNYKQIAEADYDHLNYVVDARGKLQYSGDKWQCVEYARRTWISQLDLYLPNVPRACDIWERKFVKRLSDGARVGLQMLTSGVTTHRPAVNDFIIWKKTDEQPVGHIAVVSEVTDEYVRIAEQNADNDQPWSGGHYARQFSLTCDASSGAWTMHDLEDPLHGWVRANFADVAAALPWQAPDEDRTSVDGDYGQGSAKILQKFLGVRADGDHGRATDLALGAFLNTHHQEYPRVPLKPYRVEMDRSPLIRKLQHFLNAHPLLTGAGASADTVVVENGEWDKPTVMALQTLLNRVTFADDFEAAAAAYKSGNGPPPRPNLPHGTVLGCAPSGVIAYNCNYENIPEPADGEVVDILTYAKDARGKLAYSGMKWQCVEYARRWWVSQYDLYLLNVPRACDIWTRTFVRRLSDNKSVALKMHDNGVSTVKPAVGDFLIWKRTDEQPVGHIAVVCELTDTHLRIAEQNVDNNVMWGGGHYSRQFALQRSEETGAWTIRDDEDPMFGWVRAAPDEVVVTEPFVKPAAARLPIDGVFEGATYTAMQVFVGLDVQRDFPDMDLSSPFLVRMISRMTDYALAAFLNTAYQVGAHAPMMSFRSPNYSRTALVVKLQSFLNAYPQLSGVGVDGLVIAETGEWDAATTKGCQHLLNKVHDAEHFLEALEAYGAPPS